MPCDIATDWAGVIIRLRSENESQAFPLLVSEALQKINSQPVGAALLKKLANMHARAMFGYTVAIMRPNGLEWKTSDHQWSRASLCVRVSEEEACDPQKGSPSAITWNANIMNTPDGARPPFIALAHELVHALYNIKGKAYSETEIEEYATVGLPPLQGLRKITENKIRAEHNVPLRTSYSGLELDQQQIASVLVPADE